MISGFHHGVNKIFALLGCFASPDRNLLTIRDNLAVCRQWSRSPRRLLFEGVTDRLFRNVQSNYVMFLKNEGVKIYHLFQQRIVF
jgi:hypothetical protein